MGIGTGIFLIVLGAILAFAIEPDTWEVFNLNILGYICLAAGILAIILAMTLTNQRRNTSHREVVERYDDRQPPPPAV